MNTEFVNDKQKFLFDEIAKAGELVFACGPTDISANIVGEFSSIIQDQVGVLIDDAISAS